MKDTDQQSPAGMASFEAAKQSIESIAPFIELGRVSYASGPVVRAHGTFSIGDLCKISRADGEPLVAEVVGFSGDEAVLTPFGELSGVSNRSHITKIAGDFQVPVGDGMLARVVDAMGNPLDGKGHCTNNHTYPALAAPPQPMSRPVIDQPFELGIRSIDGLLTCGIGQRLGIFAAAGGGKSTLLSMLIHHASADRCVVALIGERGREVREFVEHQLGEQGMARTTLVVATSDRPAVEQVKAAYSATAMAEYYRDQGHRVMLLMDSLTRFARAQRQIGLSAGEPPTRRGFPPSVFERLPSLLERPGNNEHGSITALYTVLVEGDDMNEPIADEVRSLLDGHIILSRQLARSGHYPAIDILSSASRVADSIISSDHSKCAAHLKALVAKYAEIELLVQIGEFQQGQDPLADEAVKKKPDIDAFLKQAFDHPSKFDDTLDWLSRAI